MVMDRSEDALQESSPDYMTDERRMIQEVARDFTMNKSSFDGEARSVRNSD